MGFTSYKNIGFEDQKITAYVPTDKQSWLDRIAIIEGKNGVQIEMLLNSHLQDAVVIHHESDATSTVRVASKATFDPANQQALQKKRTQLYGIKELFEKATDAQREQYEYEETTKPFVMFDAGPKSKIRSVLNQAEVPKDIQEAVMENLQQIWARTPGN